MVSKFKNFRLCVFLGVVANIAAPDPKLQKRKLFLPFLDPNGDYSKSGNMERKDKKRMMRRPITIYFLNNSMTEPINSKEIIKLF